MNKIHHIFFKAFVLIQVLSSLEVRKKKKFKDIRSFQRTGMTPVILNSSKIKQFIFSACDFDCFEITNSITKTGFLRYPLVRAT